MCYTVCYHSLCVGGFPCAIQFVIIVCVLGGFRVLYSLCYHSLCVGGFLCAIQFVLS